jgi:biopolymer transport protein ExbD
MPAVNQDDDDEVISAINVTPLVDVTLVLLIIFMVTATYIVANSIPVDLPEASTGEEVASTVVVYIDRGGVIHLDNRPMADDALQAALERARKSSTDIRDIISADRNIRHSRFVHAVDIVRKAGIARFAIDIQERPGESRDEADEAVVARAR